MTRGNSVVGILPQDTYTRIAAAASVKKHVSASIHQLLVGAYWYAYLHWRMGISYIAMGRTLMSCEW